MNSFLIYLFVLMTIEYKLSSSSSIPPGADRADNLSVPPMSTTASSPGTTFSVEATTVNAPIVPHSKGRNMQFKNPEDDLLVLAPLHENPIFPTFPSDDSYEILADPISHNGAFFAQPIDGPQNPPVLSNPSDEEEDMETAAQIVFRPLFAYRHQTAQKRRVYSKPSSTSNENGRRRQQSYSSNGYYPNYYPSYYPNNYYRRC